jgi:hypothetical protein
MASYRETPYGWRAEVERKGVYRSKSAFKTKGAAVAWASRMEAEIMAGERGEIPNLTVNDLLERYKQEVSAGKKGERWEIVRLTALQRDDRLALVRLRSLDTPHVAAWQQRRLKAVSSASVRRERNLLNNVFEIARKEWKWLIQEPVRRGPPTEGREARKRIASPAEIDKLTALNGQLSKRVTVALESGMRAGEIPKAQVNGRVAFWPTRRTGRFGKCPCPPRPLRRSAKASN